MMDAVTATLLAQVTREVTEARLLIVEALNNSEVASARMVKAAATLGETLGTLAGLERRFMEGRI